MKTDKGPILVREIMEEFALATGLSGPGAPRRYLWTDSFAVCNFLGLYQKTGDKKHRDLALSLVDQVHYILGRHREDDSRTGWISGLSETEGKSHPTAGGLRIGKAMNERADSEPFDEHLEWDRDGQYYHYLTKWMHALNRVSCITGAPVYNVWAVELAKAAHAGFTYDPPYGGGKRMYWKMGIDLSYPLVASMGHHDPLDGYITCCQLQAALLRFPGVHQSPDLTEEIAEMEAMLKGKSWITDDPLGIGELLSGAYRTAQLEAGFPGIRPGLAEVLLDSALPGLESYSGEETMKAAADYRLAFREFGLSIGLHAVQRLKRLIDENSGGVYSGRRMKALIKDLSQYAALSKEIEDFWLDPPNRRTESWMGHRDINMVMLATSLGPDGYLTP